MIKNGFSSRSYNMSRIKGKNTKPEIYVRKILWKKGYRYRLHFKGIPGTPDIVFTGKKKVVFIHGCFWHMHDCKYFQWPKTNKDFWKKKILGNAKRDILHQNELNALGWKFLVIWECETKANNQILLMKKLDDFLELNTSTE